MRTRLLDFCAFEDISFKIASIHLNFYQKNLNMNDIIENAIQTSLHWIF